MGKAEEYLAKKRNKAARKRLNSTIDFTHGVQAAKRRRKAGRRRICEGMCYSLPTTDDPFNDLHKEKLAKKKNEQVQMHTKNGSNSELTSRKGRAEGKKEKCRSLSTRPSKVAMVGSNAFRKESKSKVRHASGVHSEPLNDSLESHQNGVLHRQSTDLEKCKWNPSCENCSKDDSMWMCIGGNAFEVALCALVNAGMVKVRQEEDNASIGWTPSSENKSLGTKWDWCFWETCGIGSDVLVTGQAANTVFQITSVLAVVAHVAARRVSQIFSKDPIALIIVQSKEQTLQVRGIFKMLKSCLGLHAVSLHAQTALEHQIEGLRSTNAEVLIATPPRLCELMSVNAVSLSNISIMVVSGVEQVASCGFDDDLMQIKRELADNVQVILWSDCFPQSTHNVCQKLLKDPIYRVTSTECVPECCACISQHVCVLLTEDKRQQKLKDILKDCIENRNGGGKPIGPVVVFQQQPSLLHVKELVQEEGYSVNVLCDDSLKAIQRLDLSLEQLRNEKMNVLLASEDCLKQIDLAEVGIIVLYDFASSIEFYCQTLMRMARHTINGVLHSFCGGAIAPLASQLIDVLQDCLQPIPPSLRMLADAAQLVATTKCLKS